MTAALSHRFIVQVLPKSLQLFCPFKHVIHCIDGELSISRPRGLKLFG
jgi:hypothetical protein